MGIVLWPAVVMCFVGVWLWGAKLCGKKQVFFCSTIVACFIYMWLAGGYRAASTRAGQKYRVWVFCYRGSAWYSYLSVDTVRCQGFWFLCKCFYGAKPYVPAHFYNKPFKRTLKLFVGCLLRNFKQPTNNFSTLQAALSGAA